MTALPPAGPADLLLHLARRVRASESVAELRFVLVNETHVLAPYRQAALLVEGRVAALSGVTSPESNAPFVLWIERLVRGLDAQGPVELRADRLDPAVAAEWGDWLPPHALWIPFADGSGGADGGLLLARDEPWSPEVMQLLGEWTETWSFAWRAVQGPKGRRRAAAPRDLRGRIADLWHVRWQRYGLAAILLALIPVRLSVLAQGELVPARPAALRAPMDGVVERMLVAPNQRVAEGEPLFRFDLTVLNSKLTVATQDLATAEAEYRQMAQQAVYDARSKAQLAVLQGRIEERRADQEFLRGQVGRATVTAPRAGVALVDDPSEWVGKPVVTGEKIMTIADEHDAEVEAWLSPADLIDLAAGARVSLYPAAQPLHSLQARVRYVAHEAVQRPDGSYAYRLRATLESGDATARVGQKGTARVSGGRVPLVYWVLRRPIAALRPFVGL